MAVSADRIAGGRETSQKVLQLPESIVDWPALDLQEGAKPQRKASTDLPGKGIARARMGLCSHPRPSSHYLVGGHTEARESHPSPQNQRDLWLLIPGSFLAPA